MLAGVILAIRVSTADTGRVDGHTRRHHRDSPTLFPMTNKLAEGWYHDVGEEDIL